MVTMGKSKSSMEWVVIEVAIGFSCQSLYDLLIRIPVTSLVSTRSESLCPTAQTLVMKVVLMPGLADDRAVKLAHQDVEDKYTVPQLIVV